MKKEWKIGLLVLGILLTLSKYLWIVCVVLIIYGYSSFKKE